VCFFFFLPLIHSSFSTSFYFVLLSPASFCCCCCSCRCCHLRLGRLWVQERESSVFCLFFEGGGLNSLRVVVVVVTFQTCSVITLYLCERYFWISEREEYLSPVVKNQIVYYLDCVVSQTEIVVVVVYLFVFFCFVFFASDLKTFLCTRVILKCNLKQCLSVLGWPRAVEGRLKSKN